jgi:hypothetical protein
MPLLHCTKYGFTSKRQLDHLDILAAFYLFLFIAFTLLVGVLILGAHFELN